MSENSERLMPKSCFECVKSIESVYTGGCVAISKDESRIFTTCNEDIEVLDLSSGEKLAELKGDTEIVTSFAVKPDGTHLVSASRSMRITVWDLSAFKNIRSFKAHDAPVIAMDIDQSSTLVATGSADSTVKVWDIDRGYCTHNFKGHGGIVTSVKFHPSKDCLCLVSASDDGVVRVWNLKTRKCEAVLQSHESVVRSIDFTNDDDGKHMVTAARDGVINVWNWKRKALVRTIPVYEAIEGAGLLLLGTNVGLDHIRKIGSDSNTQIIYSGGERGVIRLWDMNTGEEMFEKAKELNAKHTFVDVLYLPQSQNLVAITNDQNLLFYSATNQLERIRQIVGYNEEIIDMAYLSGTQEYLAVATNTEQLRVYNTSNLNCELAYGHKDIILCLDVHGKGCIVATGSKDNTAMIWMIDMRASPNRRVVCVATAVGHTKAVGAVSLAQGLDCPFMITGSEDRTVKMWDLSPLHKIFDDPKNAYDIVEEAGPIKLNSLYTFQAHDKDINSICISPGDNVFATGSQDKTAKIWDVATGKLLGTLQGHRRGVWNITFSPVDRVVATTSGDRMVKLWSLSDFTCLKTFEGHTNSVLCVEFLTKGTQLITTGSDGLIKLWNIKDGECVLTLDKHESKIWTLAKQSTEAFVATGGADSTIYIWKDTTQEEIDRLHMEEAKVLEQQQALDNFLFIKDYRNAITLALSLDQPHRMLTILQSVMVAAEHRHSLSPSTLDDSDLGSTNSEPRAILGTRSVDDVISTLAPDQLERLLGYVRNWNTNGKLARVAQATLHCILTHYTSQALLALPSAKEIITSVQPYSERHFSRLDSLLTDSFIIDYTLHAMDTVNADGMDYYSDSED
ncbi:U3 small nucleolar RNA-associated protein [Coemansia spiralis]|uniref:U3 small nucleolar RNA-associated protein n=2 Tax=Coemansia TaxID=4863 RepID=A0A9W8G042_9FUNG|nr:U3 small nucleolar RNA-associated protein [Coemansia umbellata]KAJ2620425.1 U3 small nucleolar RNA-associated protein [Coemansia sp. RSA 1358]KAJ2673643.1 U3 small nucleolar RNA-associated protein [Coemansia spiralis]